jgi:hypothetical protein
MYPQQGFAIHGFGNGGTGQLKMLGAEFAGRLLDQQDLAIGAHGVPLR